LSKLTVIPLIYHDDLITNYHALADLPGFVLLESADSRLGRYDIVSAYPYDNLKVPHGSVDLNEAFNKLERLLPPAQPGSDLPFQGGGIGYIAYEVGAKLAGIESISHPVLSDMPLIDVSFYDWAIITDHKTRTVSLMAANHCSETALLVNEIRQRWCNRGVAKHSFALSKAFAPLIKWPEYQHAFETIHHDLTQGRAYQVNYTQPFVAQYQGDPWRMYQQVRNKNRVPFSAFLRLDSADVLSFSPERFLLMDDSQLLTSPIKGSIKRSENPADDQRLKKTLLSSSKNRAENIMIVDLLRNDLGKIALTGSVNVQSLCELQSFSGVHHLVSHIAAQCREEFTPLQAFAACFPGGSITGAPKQEAMRIISEHEPFARGIYCGSIGYFSSHGRFDSNLAIRTVVARENTLYLAAGGGIVIDSNCEDEYAECYTKIKAILSEL